MSEDETTRPDPSLIEDEEPPITELRRLPDETDDDFPERVRGLIRRRILGVQIVDICIVGPGLVLLQLLVMVGRLFGREGSGEDR